jgi:hypothetical protein
MIQRSADNRSPIQLNSSGSLAGGAMAKWKVLQGKDGNPVAVDLEKVAWIKEGSLSTGSVIYFDFCKNDTLVFVEVKDKVADILA